MVVSLTTKLSSPLTLSATYYRTQPRKVDIGHLGLGHLLAAVLTSLFTPISLHLF